MIVDGLLSSLVSHAIAPKSATPAKPATQQLTPDQQQALAKLHQAATQFEGVFMQMVMSSMRDTVSSTNILGGGSQAEQTWQGMLDDEYSQAMAKSGGLGLAAQLEQQLRARVLDNASVESHANVNDRRIEP